MKFPLNPFISTIFSSSVGSTACWRDSQRVPSEVRLPVPGLRVGELVSSRALGWGERLVLALRQASSALERAATPQPIISTEVSLHHSALLTSILDD